MNLQQLNSSGQSLRSFFITAIAALCVTGFVWFCLEQYNGGRDWIRRRNEGFRIRSKSKRSKPTFAIRVVMLLGIIEDDEDERD